VPFTPSSFAALIQANGFSLWHYRTTDNRATVSAAGYFGPAASSLKPGDLLILQAADAMALLPIRIGPALGTGVTLDGVVGPLNTVRSVAHRFSLGQAAAAVVRTIILLPLAAAVVAGSSITATAQVTGPISQVVFTLRDRGNAVLPPAQIVSVANGSATATFAAPPIGTGYRIRVEDAADPAIAQSSLTFSVGADLRLLLQEDGDWLLLESGDVLTQ
jgi:hypothetical protein